MLNSEEELHFFVYDVETTGLDVQNDRVCEIAWLVLNKAGNILQYEQQIINPTITIPKDAVEIHGITNSRVLGEPTFEDYAPRIKEVWAEYEPIIVGFNSKRYDDEIMENEFARLGEETLISEMDRIDVRSMFVKLHPRDLQAAADIYLGPARVANLKERYSRTAPDEKKKDAWHSGLFDTVVTAQVLVAMFHEHADVIPDNMEELSGWLYQRNENWIDSDGKFAYNNHGQPCVNFGKKHKGKPIVQVLDEDPGYFDWMLSAGFANDTKKICHDIINGSPPARK